MNCKPIFIDLNIGDQLTSISCGHVVTELIKFIAYQRMQIPFTYQWLKQIITKKKMSDCPDKINNYQAERHYAVASSALENLDFTIKSLLQEINNSSMPEEVCIALGSSPMMCKEAYRLLLPMMCHRPQCHSSHIASDQKIQRSVFKTLVTSEKLSQVFFNSILPLNTYIFIKKRVTNNREPVGNCDTFIPFGGCRLPRSSNVVVIDFRTANKENLCCCNDFQVYGDSKTTEDLNEVENSIEEFCEIESTNTMKWYQSTYVMKGFKDCFVNGNSATNMWFDE